MFKASISESSFKIISSKGFSNETVIFKRFGFKFLVVEISSVEFIILKSISLCRFSSVSISTEASSLCINSISNF